MLIYHLILGNTFSSAKADFEQQFGQDWKKQSRNVVGALQENGDFIFIHNTPVNRKMVRTSNTGVFITSGYLPRSAKNWNDSSKWNEYSYIVTNFAGIASSAGKK